MAASGWSKFPILVRFHTNIPYFTPKRCYCASSQRHKPELTPPGKTKSYLLRKYIGFVERTEVKFESKYPKVYKVYKLFKDGVMEFFSDTKLYYRVSTEIWAGEPLSKFSRKELEAYRQMPSDLLRSAPVLIAAPLPAAPYVYYPIAYLFPRHLLCRHFWTAEQKMEFGLHYLRHRIPCYPKILNSLEKHTSDIRDPVLRHMFVDAVQKLENNSHPSVEELLELKPLFTKKPFGIDHASILHTWYVSRSLDLSTLSKSRLINDAKLMHAIDLSMVREGIGSLSLDDLQQSCFVRGLNAMGLTREELEAYLTQWTAVSSQVDEPSLSLMLHSPVFLGYNRRSNHRYLLPSIDVQEDR